MYIAAFRWFRTLSKILCIYTAIAETGNRELAGLGTYRYLYNTGGNRELGVTLNEDGTIGKQETAADSTSAAQTAPAQTETGTDTATDPAAGTTDAAQETAPAGQDALDN